MPAKRVRYIYHKYSEIKFVMIHVACRISITYTYRGNITAQCVRSCCIFELCSMIYVLDFLCPQKACYKGAIIPNIKDLFVGITNMCQFRFDSSSNFYH